ncbi:MAG: prephenate dehydratase [Rhizobiales bacterium]|nr:prephenate dehydratase [Hyphomicrobiales bacterium]
MNAASAKRIVFQGELGANSHIACAECYPDWEHVACRTFEDAFATLKAGDADLAMIPIENSVAGRVADIHHLLPGSDTYIIAEHFQRIHHQLLAGEGASLDTIKTVHSHVHALGQCRDVIRELGLEAVVAVDTAGAARELAETPDPTRSVIATGLAAEIYGLKTLRADIEDAEHNTTRFVVLSNTPDDAEPEDAPVMTTFIFRVRNVPAALYKAMGGFATNGVNMTKLESYQLEGEFFATQFYADVEGHPDDKGVKFALEELSFFSAELKILGVYKSHAYRIEHSAKRNGGH